MRIVILLAVWILTGCSALGAQQARVFRFDLRQAFRLYEVDPDGRSELKLNETSFFDPRNELQLVWVPSALDRFLADYASMTGTPSAPRSDLLRRAVEALRFEAEMQLADGSADQRPLVPEATQTPSGEVIAVRFTPEDLFARGGMVPSHSTLHLRSNFRVSRDGVMLDYASAAVDPKSMPFSKVLMSERTLLDRVELRLRDGEAPRAIRYVRPVSFVDHNEPIHIETHGNLEVQKEVLQEDGDWAAVEIIRPTRERVGTLIVDAALDVGKTYRYRFYRPYLQTDGSVRRTEVMEPARQFVVDDYGPLVFVPVSGLKLEDKVLLPLVVPLTNRPDAEGSSFQLGPGLSFPIFYINPRPRGSAVTGVRTLRAKVGVTIAALREREPDEDAEGYGSYIGPWASLFDLIQFGVGWRLDSERAGKPMTYLGFSMLDLANLLR